MFTTSNNRKKQLKTRKQQNRAGLVLLVGLAAFLYQIQDILRHHTGDSFDYYTTPPGAGEIVFALFAAVVAMLGALGVSPSSIMSNLKGDRDQ